MSPENIDTFLRFKGCPLSVVHALDSGRLLTIRDRAAAMIRCLEGRVLVSLQGCLSDYELASGMTLNIQGNPLVLIEACSDALVAIEPSARYHRRIWPVLGSLLLFALAGTLAAEYDTESREPKSIAYASHDHEAQATVWRAGRNMIAPDGVIATNRVISTYERMHLSRERKP